MALIKISLNGREVEVDAASTILEAARQHGIEIPTLCDDPQLPPFTSCWICAVKLEGMKRYIPSCGTRVAPGMKIWTDTDDVRAVRKMALELLLSNHRGDCVAPCKAACPAGVDVQGYIALISQGKYREAAKLVKEVNPFPLSIGRVCTRPCESECRRNAVDGPVGIDYLKRFAADWDAGHDDAYVPTTAASTGRRVAMVGAGPGSLTAAYYLAQKGHEVTIMEALPAAGGMLRYGIPEYRLPKKTLDTEIGLITTLGVRVEYNKALGRDFKLADLFADGYDAVFLGLGAMGSRKMKVPGEELEGVWAGTEFLKKMGLGEDVAIGKHVAVIGGGNTAVDAARTSLRLGAEKVTIVYRRSRTEMPAWDVEVEAALEEGVEMHFLAAPTRIEGEGACERMEFIRMELGEPDESGRRRPVPVEGSEAMLEVDNVIAAIGQVPDLSAIHETVESDPESLEAKLELTRWGTIVADETTGATSVERVYSGGDVARGAATAIEAIADGGKAAAAIHSYLTGETEYVPPSYFNITKERWDSFPESQLVGIERSERERMPELGVEERIRIFEEVELGYTEEQARREAARCLECGCVGAFTCQLREYAAEYGASSDRFGGEVVEDPADERHPFIRLEPEKCILCGRCIRICQEVEGAAALGFFRRGFQTQMKPALEQALAGTTCESCGQCVTSCPTAAISAVADLPKPGPWALEATRSTCSFCGTGCAIVLRTVEGSLATIEPAPDAGINEGNLCVRGRFGHLAAGERLASPLVKRNGKPAAASWDDAVGLVSKRLMAVAREHGPGAVAVFGSPGLTNEEAYRLQQLARAGLGTPNVASFGLARESAVFEALSRAFGRAASTASYADLRSAETILLIDSDIAEEETVSGIAIRKAVAAGARLVVISPDETRMARLADVWIRVGRADVGSVLAAMIEHATSKGLAGPARVTQGVDNLEEFKAAVAAISEGGRVAEGEPVVKGGDTTDAIVAAAEAYASASRAVLVATGTAFEPATAGRDASLAVGLAVLSGHAEGGGSGILFLRARANGQGLTDAGLDPRFLPGHAPATSADARARVGKLHGAPVPAPSVGDAAALFAAIEDGSVRAALVVGEDPVAGADDPDRVRRVLGKLDFLAVLDVGETETTPLAAAVLPLASLGERAGTFTNSERRVQRVGGPLAPPSGRTNLEVLGALAVGLGLGTVETDAIAVAKEAGAAWNGTGNAGGSAADGFRWGGETLYPDRFATGTGRADLSVPEPRTPAVVFDPRWADPLEGRLSHYAEDAGLPPHVVARGGDRP